MGNGKCFPPRVPMKGVHGYPIFCGLAQECPTQAHVLIAWYPAYGVVLKVIESLGCRPWLVTGDKTLSSPGCPGTSSDNQAGPTDIRLALPPEHCNERHVPPPLACHAL